LFYINGGTSRRPIPDNWHSIGQRSSPYHLAGNRNAAHPVNAILNYAYAALESEIRIQAISEGYDPMIGVMHEGSDGSSKFIFDLMEPERPRVDRAMLDFVKGHVFDPADFVIRTDGVCRLNPKLARMVVAKVSCRESTAARPGPIERTFPRASQKGTVAPEAIGLAAIDHRCGLWQPERRLFSLFGLAVRPIKASSVRKQHSFGKRRFTRLAESARLKLALRSLDKWRLNQK
jgi:CRISPR associated protein Cas1